MIYTCAWCKGNLPQSDPEGGERVSHGICLDCIDEHFPDVASKYRELREVES